MSDLEEIKQRIDIVSFINDYLTLKKAGRNFKALCPFHSEKTPSFIVSPERQIWHCFGCGEGGDIFTFLMKIENLEFPEALEILAKKTGVRLTRNYRITQDQKIKEEILRANMYASNFYHYLLTSHKIGEKARHYLEKRKITAKIIKTFSLGYAPSDWDSLLQFLRRKGFPDSVLNKAGLIVAKGNHVYDRFRGRLIFSLKNHRGEVVGFSGRKISEDRDDKEAKYINTSETPVYVKGNLFYGLDVTKEAIRKANEAIIVEGEFDLLSSYQTGVTNVVAIKGTALTLNQVNLLKRFTETVSFALDSDIAGDSAAKRGIEIAENAGLNLKVISIPLGKDPDECIRQNPSLWKKAVAKSIPVYDFILISALKRFNKDEAFGKKKIVDQVLPFFARISNPIVQSHYLNLLAKKLEISEEKILEVLERMKKGRMLNLNSLLPAQEEKQRSLSVEEYFLSLLLQAPTVEQINKEFSQEDITKIDLLIKDPAVRRIINLFLKWIKNLKEATPQTPAFIRSLPQELITLADKAYLFDLGEAIRNKENFENEFRQTKHNLILLSLRRRLKELSTKIRNAVEEKVLESLNKEFNSLKKELKELEKFSLR